MKMLVKGLVGLLEKVGDGDVREGWAGGSVVLWVVNDQNHVVCLTEDDGPFSPRLSQVGEIVVDVEAFCIGVYGDADEYLMGGAAREELVSVPVDDELTHLQNALEDAAAL